jgi:hypothetical protein
MPQEQQIITNAFVILTSSGITTQEIVPAHPPGLLIVSQEHAFVPLLQVQLLEVSVLIVLQLLKIMVQMLIILPVLA